MKNERKDKHRLLAKLAGIPWEFQCPKCYGSWFGSSTRRKPYLRYSTEVTVTKRYCHNENRSGCHWEGTDDECRRVPDYDDPDEMGAWVPVWKALWDEVLWELFIIEWAKGHGISTYRCAVNLDGSMLKDFLNDLPGQVDAAIEALG